MAVAGVGQDNQYLLAVLADGHRLIAQGIGAQQEGRHFVLQLEVVQLRLELQPSLLGQRLIEFFFFKAILAN
ncbi:MAG: hypothetical protein KatS3mg072_1993 [Meiothermus sp.]|nr:MAG: hypothetical protein KatS3mg072_1993 [Meiothermus sp.]